MRSKPLLFLLFFLVLLTSVLVFTGPPAVSSRNRDQVTTPTAPAPGERRNQALQPQSGDTQGMILGASLIVLIIIIGLILQGNSLGRKSASADHHHSPTHTP